MLDDSKRQPPECNFSLYFGLLDLRLQFPGVDPSRKRREPRCPGEKPLLLLTRLQQSRWPAILATNCPDAAKASA